MTKKKGKFDTMVDIAAGMFIVGAEVSEFSSFKNSSLSFFVLGALLILGLILT